MRAANLKSCASPSRFALTFIPKSRKCTAVIPHITYQHLCFAAPVAPLPIRDAPFSSSIDHVSSRISRVCNRHDRGARPAGNMGASRKRGRQEMEAVEPPKEPSLLERIRNMWEFANLVQWIFIFGRVVKIDENLDIEVRPAIPRTIP
jgi:hypothetical protein